ncbi:MAG: SLBB domain-containing protein [candidate division WOR-3 bacterium]
MIFLTLYFQDGTGGIFIVPKDYTINPGDLLRISIYSKSVKTLDYTDYVDNDGFFPLIFSPNSKPERVKLLGLTLDSASKVILNMFRNFVKIKGIDGVSVNLVKPSEFYVYIYGNVQKSGPLKVNSLTRLSDVIFSENVLPFSALSRVVLNGNVLSIWRGLRGDIKNNPLLKNVDSIFVPKTDSVVYVVGYLTDGFIKPVEYNSGDDVFTIIWKIGYGKDLYKIFKAFINGKIADLNDKVSPGDTISLMIFPNYVIVVGEVSEPKRVEYQPGLTVLDYINLAGGFSDRADKRRISIKMFWNNRTKRVPLDYKPMPGDAIYVPRVILTYQEILSTLSFILSATTLYFVITK